MTLKEEINTQFNGFVSQAFPGLNPLSSQYVDLRRCFLAGIVVTIEKMSRPQESEEEAMTFAKEALSMIGEEMKHLSIQVKQAGNQ